MTREEIIKELKRAKAAYNYNAFAALTEAIEILTQKPKHVKAKWINPSQDPEIMNKELFSDCSLCGFVSMNEYKYCPNCGSRMED